MSFTNLSLQISVHTSFHQDNLSVKIKSEVSVKQMDTFRDMAAILDVFHAEVARLNQAAASMQQGEFRLDAYEFAGITSINRSNKTVNGLSFNSPADLVSNIRQLTDKVEEMINSLVVNVNHTIDLDPETTLDKVISVVESHLRMENNLLKSDRLIDRFKRL